MKLWNVQTRAFLTLLAVLATFSSSAQTSVQDRARRGALKKGTICRTIDPSFISPLATTATGITLQGIGGEAEAIGNISALVPARTFIVPISMKVNVPVVKGETVGISYLTGNLKNNIKASLSVGLSGFLSQPVLSPRSSVAYDFRHDSLVRRRVTFDKIFTAQTTLAANLSAKQAEIQAYHDKHLQSNTTPIMTTAQFNPGVGDVATLTYNSLNSFANPGANTADVIIDTWQTNQVILKYRYKYLINILNALQSTAQFNSLTDFPAFCHNQFSFLDASAITIAEIDADLRELEKTNNSMFDNEKAEVVFKKLVDVMPAQYLIQLSPTYSRKSYIYQSSLATLLGDDQVDKKDIWQITAAGGLFLSYTKDQRWRFGFSASYTYSLDYKDSSDSKTYLVPVAGQPNLFTQRDAILGRPQKATNHFISLNARLAYYDAEVVNALFAFSPTYSFGNIPKLGRGYSFYLPIYLFQEKKDDKLTGSLNGGIFINLEGKTHSTFVAKSVDNVSFGVFIGSNLNFFSFIN